MIQVKNVENTDRMVEYDSQPSAYGMELDALQAMKTEVSSACKKLDKWDIATVKHCNSMVRLQVRHTPFASSRVEWGSESRLSLSADQACLAAWLHLSA